MAKKKKPAAPPVLAMGITCADAAALLKCSKTHVSYLIQTGELTAQRVGGRFLLVDPASVVKYNADPKRRNRLPKAVPVTASAKTVAEVERVRKKAQSKKKTAARKMDVLHPGLVKIKRKKKAKAVKKATKKTTVKKKSTAKKKTRRKVRV